jgi:hypothetical protein
VDLALGLASLRHQGLWERSEQGHRRGYVLAHPSEVREPIVILDDPSVHVTALSVRAFTVMHDFLLECRAFLF